MKKSMAFARVSSEMMFMNRSCLLLLTAESGVKIQGDGIFNKQFLRVRTFDKNRFLFLKLFFQLS